MIVFIEEWIQPISAVFLSVLLPFVVALMKRYEWSSGAKQLIAICVSVIAAVIAGLLVGIPTSETLALWVFAVIGGMKTAYAFFSNIGVTSRWLDALDDIGNTERKGKVIDVGSKEGTE